MVATTPQLDPLALERQVCFALAVTNRAVLAVYRPLLEPLGLTHPQYLVMLALWDHQKSASTGQPALSVKQIASALQLDSATLSPMLKRLEALGLITRTRSASDERATDIELTTAGIALRTRALNIPPAVVARLGVEMAELEQLHHVLTRINTAALAAGALDSATT
ncbi:MarR family winged helix-turn-helix transcriptional regulator [Mycolicibacterium komossense]|uniref:MarR family transcriptional regulator n=1 Tax=Mycolicibacterium komossense TaxID=1779 RepID=A0ABT3CG91_9MYCO|nr:MarR family transcriptional regulator [Mycolicibacterium komossense]MCV7228402.1 MarR family transcriptional regulator [Mycolicibacterium komossense]